MITSASKYAVRALTGLALEADGKFVPAAVLGKQLGISGTFLAKILKRLVDHGMAESHRGPTGGLRLAVPADQITVRDVIVAIDGDSIFTECLLGLPGCGDCKPCAVHDHWAATRSSFERGMKEKSISDLAAGVRSGENRNAP